jgi:antitoxin component YwqK of YwqJK toxin-antitoxin module
MRIKISAVFPLLLLLAAIACHNESTFDGKNGLKIIHYKGTGVVKARINYKKGKADGLYQSYYPTGRLQSETFYAKGQRNGKATFYHENGKVKSEDFYKKNQQDSISKVYDKEGNLKVACFYREGRFHNTYTAYFPNGKVKQEMHYKEGMLDGEQKQFYPSGQLKNVTWYRSGFPGTGTRQFAESGKPLEPGVTFTVEEINQLALKGEYCYRVRLNKPRPDDQVYLGTLLEGRYMHPSMFPLRKKDGYFEHVYNVPRYGSYTEAATLIVKTKTATGEDLVLSRKLNVSLNNFY